MSSTKSTIDSALSASNLPQRIAAALAAGCRGGAARKRMSPEMSYGRHAGPAPHTARRAAVTLLLFPRAGHWRLPLIERPATLARHAGQISIPGGSVDPGESSSQAALRELREELGIDAGLEILGRLEDCYVFASDFRVTPWLAATDLEPRWVPHAPEVHSVVELPLEVLLDDRSIGQISIERGPFVFHAPCLNVNDACVWGATSVILAELADVLRQLERK